MLSETELIEIIDRYEDIDIRNMMATELLALREQLAAIRWEQKPVAFEAEGVSSKVDITCYSCRRFITFQQHAEADGFCPYCNVEIELTPPDLAHPDVRTIEDNLIEQVGLMCDRAVNIHEKNVYGGAFCVLKYGILPYLRKKGK